MVQRRLRPDEIAQPIERYKAGVTERELGAQFGIYRTTVAAHLERAGVLTRRGRGLQPEEDIEAASVYDRGWSAGRLGKKYGVGHHIITAALRKAGFTIRSRGRPARGLSGDEGSMAGGSTSR